MASGRTTPSTCGKPGHTIVTMYSHIAQTINFSLNNRPAAERKLPLDPTTQFSMKNYPDWEVWHFWNKADCGEINFPGAGLQLLTLHYRRGNNLAYFDFLPTEK
jgi:hypothetical protein